MGCITGMINYFARILLKISIIVMILQFLPYLPTNAKTVKPYRVPKIKPLEGKLALNNRLDEVEKWHEGDVFGPEAYTHYKGELYTGLTSGIVKLVKNRIVPIAQTGKACKDFHEESLCGRPLGLRFDKNGYLYVADAYNGIFKVDVNSGEKVLLVSVNQTIDGVKPKLPNSLDIDSNGNIYWTDSSTEYDLQDNLFDIFSDGSGRLIRYDAKTKQNKVLLKNISFANGVHLADDESFVIISEMDRSRILRYYLTGPKKNSHDIFLDGIPGFPDNINSDGKGGFLLPLAVSADSDHPIISQSLGPYPSIRKVLVRLLGITEQLKQAYKIYPNEFLLQASKQIVDFLSSNFFSNKRVTILHVSKTGEILDSIHSTNGKFGTFSDATIFKDTLYLGSPFRNFIGRIPLAKVGWQHLEQKVKCLRHYIFHNLNQI